MSSQEGRVVTVIGGTGFLGRYVVRKLAKNGYRVQVIARDASAADELKTSGVLGQVAVFSGDMARPETIVPRLTGSFAVINLVGLLFERRKQRFATVHTKGAEALAQAAAKAGVSRFIHISALGVDRALTSDYARTKLAGEEAVRAAFPKATIFRPSVIFGPEDNFFNMFARMAAMVHILPVIGGGKTQLQPVYADDVAEAIITSLAKPESQGQTYELGGPEIYTLRQIQEYVLAQIQRKALLIPLPFPLAGLKAFFLEYLPTPTPLLTRDQVRLLRYDNIAQTDTPGFTQLGIAPTAMDMIVPGYLRRYRKPARQLSAA